MIVGIGMDIVEVERIRTGIERYGKRFIERIFTDNEIDYCNNKKTSYIHYAGRFAVKEAFSKAIGTGFNKGLTWQDIETINSLSGKPEIITKGKAKDMLKELGIENTFVTITHTKTICAAVVIIGQ